MIRVACRVVPRQNLVEPMPLNNQNSSLAVFLSKWAKRSDYLKTFMAASEENICKKNSTAKLRNLTKDSNQKSDLESSILSKE